MVGLAPMVATSNVVVSGSVRGPTKSCGIQPSRHWYYRTDRTTQRQCWYLKPEGEKVRATVDQPTAAAQPPSAPKTKPVSTPAPQTFEAAAVETTVDELKAAKEDLPVAVESVQPSDLGKPNQSIDNGVLTNKRIADEAPIKTSSADEHSVTEMSDVAVVAPSVATTEPPAEYEITFTKSRDSHCRTGARCHNCSHDL